MSVLSKFSAINLKRKTNFPGGPVVKNLPSSAGDAGWILVWGTKILHVTGQLSPLATTTKPRHFNKKTRILQLERGPRTPMEDPMCFNEDHKYYN